MTTRIMYKEELVRWVTVEIPEDGLKGEDLEEACRDIIFLTVQEEGWDGEDVLDTHYDEVTE